MRIVYIAGRFGGDTPWKIHANTFAAERAGLQVAELGAMPLIPHANTAHFHGTCTDEFWIAGTMELLRRCDALFNFDPLRAQTSVGTQGEIAEARWRGMPVFQDLEDLAAWIVAP